MTKGIVDTLPPKPTVFELDRLAEYSDDAILDEMRRVANITPDDGLTTRSFNRHAKVTSGTVRLRFGSWEKALSLAGLSDRWKGSRAARQAATERLSDHEILQAIVGLANSLGKDTLTRNDITAHLPFNGAILAKRWGSLRLAFEAAGIYSNPRGRRYSDEECFDNLLQVWTHYGRPPRIREMDSAPSKIGTTPYITRFVTWKKALTVFVERVNSDLGLKNFDIAIIEPIKFVEQPSPTIQNSERDKRDISLGVRFAVLSRDRFKCVLCGDCPSINLACVLHIDHIVPWSKGGRTAIENLRALCDACNLGRGNRYEE